MVGSPDPGDVSDLAGEPDKRQVEPGRERLNALGRGTGPKKRDFHGALAPLGPGEGFKRKVTALRAGFEPADDGDLPWCAGRGPGDHLVIVYAEGIPHHQ